MTAAGRQAVLRLLGSTLALLAVYFLARDWAARTEATLAVTTSRLLFGDVMRDLGAARILVLPDDEQPFIAIVSVSCSSITSILALGVIAFTVLPGPLHRRGLAFWLGAWLIITANWIRISASVLIGTQAGIDGLILFHDSVAALFGLAYTAAGFFFMLWWLLPNKSATEAAVEAATGRGALAPSA